MWGELVRLGHLGEGAGEVDEGVAAVGGGEEEDVEGWLGFGVEVGTRGRGGVGGRASTLGVCGREVGRWGRRVGGVVGGGDTEVGLLDRGGGVGTKVKGELLGDDGVEGGDVGFHDPCSDRLGQNVRGMGLRVCRTRFLINAQHWDPGARAPGCEL